MLPFGALFCFLVLGCLVWFVKRSPHDTPLERRLVVIVFTALVVVLIGNSAAVLVSRSLERRQYDLKEEQKQMEELRKASEVREKASRLEEEEEVRNREWERKQREAQKTKEQERERKREKEREAERERVREKEREQEREREKLREAQAMKEPNKQGPAQEKSKDDTESFWRDNLRRVRSEQELKLELALSQAKERAKERTPIKDMEELKRRQAEREMYERMRAEYARLAREGDFGDDEDTQQRRQEQEAAPEEEEEEEEGEGEDQELEEEEEDTEQAQLRRERRLAPLPPRDERGNTAKSLKESLVESVTVMIKTHARYECVMALVASIRKFYSDIRILVADDGVDERDEWGKKEQTQVIQEIKRAYEGPAGGLEYFVLPYDVGLSVARNFLLDQVKTKYFVTCDDDFVFGDETRLESWLLLLEEFESIDIVGGVVYGEGKPGETKPENDYAGLLDVNEDNHVLSLRKRNLSPLEDGRYRQVCSRVELIVNWFMGRTELVRKIKWDEKLKLGEHQDFFLRAKARGLNIVSCRNVKVHHKQREPDPEYKRKRMREFQFLQLFLRKHNLASMELFSGLTYVRNAAVDMKAPVKIDLSWE